MHYGCFQQLTQLICALQHNFIIMCDWRILDRPSSITGMRQRHACVCVRGGWGSGWYFICISGEGRKPPSAVPRFLPFYINWYRRTSTLTGPIQISNHSDNGGSTFGCWKSTGSYQQANWALRNRLEGKWGVTRISDNACAWHGSVITHAQSRDNHVRSF